MERVLTEYNSRKGSNNTMRIGFPDLFILGVEKGLDPVANVVENEIV